MLRRSGAAIFTEWFNSKHNVSGKMEAHLWSQIPYIRGPPAGCSCLCLVRPQSGGRLRAEYHVTHYKSEVELGFGRIVDLHCRSPTLFHISSLISTDILDTSVSETTMRPNPRWSCPSTSQRPRRRPRRSGPARDG
jgi:hypothetical protein